LYNISHRRINIASCNTIDDTVAATISTATIAATAINPHWYCCFNCAPHQRHLEATPASLITTIINTTIVTTTIANTKLVY
jgi:hypothetical protein